MMENLDVIKKDHSIRDDRLRYEKNSLPAVMSYLSIVFDVIYFIVVYRINDYYFYDSFMAVSVVCNLLFLLMAFLSSEEIKNYKKNFAFFMIGLGVVQIVRIFIYPMLAHEAISTTNVGEIVMSDGLFAACIIFLICSAACMFIGAAVGIIRCIRLEAHLNKLNKGE